MKIILFVLIVLIPNLLLANGLLIPNDPLINKERIREVACIEVTQGEDGPSKSMDFPKLKKTINNTGKYPLDTLGYDNPREINRLGLNLTLGGPLIAGPMPNSSLSIDYFVTPNFNIEAGLKILGIYGGMKYHLMGKTKTKWTPYLGLYLASTGSLLVVIYTPVGIQYWGNRGFTYGFELAWWHQKFSEALPLWGAIKVGYHFNVD